MKRLLRSQSAKLQQNNTIHRPFPLVFLLSCSLLFTRCKNDTELIRKVDFGEVAGITLNGKAKELNPNQSKYLVLTDDYWQTGSAFLTKAVELGKNASFSSYFVFQIENPRGLGEGADGICFVLQTVADTAGSVGGGIGYGGIQPSIAVEFDTYDNGEINDNHIGINLNGEMNSVAAIAAPEKLDDGTPWHAWVDFNGEKEMIEIRVARSSSRPPVSVLMKQLNLNTIFNGKPVFAGFTSGTGGGAGDHKILAWQLFASYKKYEEDRKPALTINIVHDQSTALAIGDEFIIDVNVTGTSFGDQFPVQVTIGEESMEVPVFLLDEETGERSVAGAAFFNESHYYQSEPVTVNFPKNNKPVQKIEVRFDEASAFVDVSGINHLAALKWIDTLVSHAQHAGSWTEAKSVLDTLTYFLSSANDTELMEYANTSLLSAAENSVNAAVLFFYSGEFLRSAGSLLNQKLRAETTQAAANMIEAGWWDDDALENSIAKQSFALLKLVALNNILNRLTELNYWKKGAGAMRTTNFLEFPHTQAISYLSKIDDVKEAVSFTKLTGTANADAVNSLYTNAIDYATKNGDALKPIWERMTQARKDFKRVSSYIELVFDYSYEKKLYANLYMQNESDYRRLLGNYQILSVLIENQDGEMVPAWQALLGETDPEGKFSCIGKSVAASEGHLHEMLGDLIEMRDIDDIANLGSPVYSNLHQMARSLNAPLANDLVNTARSFYELKKSYVPYNTLEDFISKGLWVGYGIGCFFPPALYVTGVIDMAQSGIDVLEAYQEAAAVETSANAGFTTELDRDQANSSLKKSIGLFTVNSIFVWSDISALRLWWAARGLGLQSKPALKTLLFSKEKIKRVAEADAEYFKKLQELEAKADRYRKWSGDRKVDMEKYSRKMEYANLKKTNPGDYEAQRAKLIEKRAGNQRKYIKHKHALEQTLQAIKDWKMQRYYSGTYRKHQFPEGAVPGKPVLESKGALSREPNFVSATARTERSIATSIRADIGEVQAYNEAIFKRGEIGIQRPMGSNVPGIDFITAIKPSRGKMEILVTDVKTSTKGDFPKPSTTLPSKWKKEIEEAIRPERLDLGDKALEEEIREAFKAGRVKMRQIEVNYSPQGQGKIMGFDD